MNWSLVALRRIFYFEVDSALGKASMLSLGLIFKKGNVLYERGAMITFCIIKRLIIKKES